MAGIILIVAVRTCMMKKRLHRGSININYNANCVTFFTGKDDEAKNRFIALAQFTKTYSFITFDQKQCIFFRSVFYFMHSTRKTNISKKALKKHASDTRDP